MHRDHEIFIEGIEQEKRLELNYFSRKHRLRGCSQTSRTICAPLHFSKGPAGLDPNSGVELECYYLWDFGATKGSNFLALSPSEIVSMKLTDEVFHVQEFYRQSSRSEKSGY